MISTDVQEAKLDAEELLKLIKLTQRPSVRQLMQTRLDQIKQQLSQAGEQQKPIATAVKTSTDVKTYRMILNYLWDQTDTQVKLYLTKSDFAPELKKEDVVLNVKQDGRTACVTICDNARLTIANLLHPLAAEGHCVRFTSSSLVICFKKQQAQRWTSLQAKADASSKDRITARNDDDDPSKSLMNLMKKMYDEGDDNMKRTINQAWHQSGNKQQSPSQFPNFDLDS